MVMNGHAISRPNIIDIEASGFGSYSYPIEVGVVTDDDSKYCSLIMPPSHWNHWDEEAQKVHQIERDNLELHGRSARDVAISLNELLSGKTVYTDGWVVDKPWITALFHEAGMELQFTVSSLEMILSESQMACWHAIKDEVIAESGLERHRASNDAWIIQETWSRTSKHIRVEN